jgi:hypothetical protein
MLYVRLSGRDSELHDFGTPVLPYCDLTIQLVACIAASDLTWGPGGTPRGPAR